MNTIEEIPLNVLGQVVQGIIFTMLGLEVQPLKIELPPPCFKDADAKTRVYAAAILEAMESSRPLPVPTTPWQFQTYLVLESLMKQRIEQFLKEGNPIADDRVGRIVKSYLSDTSLDGTFHDYLRHGSLRSSKYGRGWIAKMTHQIMPRLQGAELNQIGRLWLRGFRLSGSTVTHDSGEIGGVFSL